MELLFDCQKMRLAATPPMKRPELARRMGVSYNFLYLLERGLMPWPPARKSQVPVILAEWQANPTPTPRKVRKDTGKRHKRPRGGWTRATRRGATSHFSKLTDDLVREAKFSKEHPLAEAKRLGVTLRTIKAIRDGETWKHITPVPHSHGEVTGIG